MTAIAFAAVWALAGYQFGVWRSRRRLAHAAELEREILAIDARDIADDDMRALSQLYKATGSQCLCSGCRTERGP